MKVYIAQLKCPSGHCVVAAAGEFESLDEAKVLSYRLGLDFGKLVESGQLKHECGLCHATDLHVDLAATVYATMAEAQPALERSMVEQALSALFLRAGRN